MLKIVQYILPFESQQGFTDKILLDRYLAWDMPLRQIQISVITTLTALLYIIFIFIDKSWASEQVQSLMLKVYLLIIVPMLLIISLLAFNKKYYQLVMLALAAYPIVSLSCHAYIASKLTNYSPFLTEGYLGVLWIFIVSGLTFKYAVVSALTSSIILLVSAFYFISQTDLYVMHVFWVLCSFSFGFLGALIFDRSRKAIFINQQALHRLAITDPLTGLFNRNQLQHVLSQEIERSLRYNRTFGFLLVDIDYFKTVNDNFGHDTGDAVLQKVAQVLSKSVRENDTLIRWGGEEFVVIAIEVDEESLICLSNKLREDIELEQYGVSGQITISVGATLFRKNDSQDSLLARADKALYQAKDNGRNLTIFV